VTSWHHRAMARRFLEKKYIVWTIIALRSIEIVQHWVSKKTQYYDDRNIP
jgi:hypothetical protein